MEAILSRVGRDGFVLEFLVVGRALGLGEAQ